MCENAFVRFTPTEALAEWVVYRLLGDLDQVLYVGMTGNFRGRMRGHRRNTDLWRLVRAIETETFPDKEVAGLHESALIYDLDPPYNSSGRRTREGELEVGVSGEIQICPTCGAKVMPSGEYLVDLQYEFLNNRGIGNRFHLHHCRRAS